MTVEFIEEWECLSYEVRLRKLVFFSLEKASGEILSMCMLTY